MNNWMKRAKELIQSAGRGKVELYQNKRYLDVDVISVDGKWYPLYTLPNRTEPMGLLGNTEKKAQESIDPWWIDDNGRYITE